MRAAIAGLLSAPGGALSGEPVTVSYDPGFSAECLVMGTDLVRLAVIEGDIALAHVCAKLGISSRTQLAAHVARRREAD